MDPKKHSWLRSFGFAFKGLEIAWRERNFRFHVFSSIFVIGLGIYLTITPMEWMIILLCIGMVMSLEIINTSIEHLVNIVNPDFNEKAGKVKDLAAAAVLVASMIAAITGLLVFLPHLY